MMVTAGIDVGSTYTKAALVDEECRLVATALRPTGFRLDDAAQAVFDEVLAAGGIMRSDVAYIASTGYGRYTVGFRDVQVTDLTAQARGARQLFPGTMTVLDIGGQTMKAMRLDERGRISAFRLNDKCAAGTGAFLEKTARYLGHSIEEIGAIAGVATAAVPISGVCAVFAESEVINHVSQGASPGEILLGAMASLVQRSVQLMRRVRMEPEFTLVGGILRFPTMARLVREQIGAGTVNVPASGLAQFTAALGAAILARRRLERLGTLAQV